MEEKVKKEIEFYINNINEIDKGNELLCDLIWNAILRQLKESKETCNITKELVNIENMDSIKRLYLDKNKSIVIFIPRVIQMLKEEGIKNITSERSTEGDSIFLTFSISRNEVLSIIRENYNQKSK